MANWDLESVKAVTAYSVCSASLVLINKLTVTYLPFPSIIIFTQLTSTLVFLWIGKLMGAIQLDPLTYEKLKPYIVYTLAFTGGIFANMKSLESSNVETVIVFRSCSPLAVSVLEALFLGREWPSSRSWLALVTIVVGAVMYANSDENFARMGLSAYVWPLAYLATISFSMTYGKVLVSGVKLDTFWGPVLYANILGAPPMLFSVVTSGEIYNFHQDSVTGMGFSLLMAGCVVGTAISYTGWYARSRVSAASYTLVGVMNKFATILVNCLIWDNHASPTGILSLVICLGGGLVYQQAPIRLQPSGDSEDIEKGQT